MAAFASSTSERKFKPEEEAGFRTKSSNFTSSQSRLDAHLKITIKVAYTALRGLRYRNSAEEKGRETGERQFGRDWRYSRLIKKAAALAYIHTYSKGPQQLTSRRTSSTTCTLSGATTQEPIPPSTTVLWRGTEGLSIVANTEDAQSSTDHHLIPVLSRTHLV